MSFPEQASKDLPDGSRVNVQPEEGNSLEELLSHVTCRVHRARIAQQVGFSDQSYLSRVFRAGEGSSPTEYRARNTLSKS